MFDDIPVNKTVCFLDQFDCSFGCGIIEGIGDLAQAVEWRLEIVMSLMQSLGGRGLYEISRSPPPGASKRGER